jgi:hypothetical protein
MSAKSAREAAFNVYAANLTACFPGVRDVFVCPFCRQGFGRDALGDPPKVILAHCLPKSLGGRLTALACAACDNAAGGNVDVHLKNRFETEDYFQGRSPESRRIWVQIGEHRVRADMTLTVPEEGQPSVVVVLDQRHSPPADVAGVLKTLTAEATRPQGLSFQFQGSEPFNVPMSRIAMLRSAFLMMFRHFGYSYILHSNLDRVREQLLRPTEPILPCSPCVNMGTTQEHSNTVGVITSPKASRAFWVPMRFQTEGGRAVCMGVIMPGLGDDRDRIYDWLAETQQRGSQARFRYRIIAYEAGRLSRPEAVPLPYRVWRDLEQFPEEEALTTETQESAEARPEGGLMN